MAGLHTDGHGNVTYRAPMQNTTDRFQYQQQPQSNGFYGSYGQYGSGNPSISDRDPFAHWANAFDSIVPPGAEHANENALDSRGLSGEAPGLQRKDDTLEAYRNFLLDGGIDPDTIGNARIDRRTGKMMVPRVAQEYAAVNMKDRDNATEGSMRKAGAIGAAREFNTRRGGVYAPNSFKSRIQQYLNSIMGWS